MAYNLRPAIESDLELMMRIGHDGNRTHTKSLLLRPFQDSDVEDARSYRDDPEFARFLPNVPQPFTKTDAEAF